MAGRLGPGGALRLPPLGSGLDQGFLVASSPDPQRAFILLWSQLYQGEGGSV